MPVDRNGDDSHQPARCAQREKRGLVPQHDRDPIPVHDAAFAERGSDRGSQCRQLIVTDLMLTEPHHHDDHEAFVIVEGSAVVTVGGDEPPGPAEVLVRGDVVFVPSGVEHIISNRGDVTLRLLAIWWEAGIRPRPTGGAA